MKIKCLGCGVEKDMEILEVFPYPEENMLCEDPLPPLFVLECQPWSDDKEDRRPWRVVIVCHECFRKLEPDMWISERCWKNINAVTPFEELPLNNLPSDTESVLFGKWNPESYV